MTSLSPSLEDFVDAGQNDHGSSSQGTMSTESLKGLQSMLHGSGEENYFWNENNHPGKLNSFSWLYELDWERII